MDAFERWLEVKAIVEKALELPSDERAAFLDRACGTDEDLRCEVEALLHAPALPTSSLSNLLGLPDRAEDPDYVEGDVIDHFMIVRRIQGGGMGVVYEARDTRNNNRPVALKVLLSRAAKLSQDKRIAGFADPSIVTFHDSGETSEGLPYFVFEYVEGEPITTFCDRRSLGISERLRLFQKLCGALVYAHQRLIIHCDLKPENILITATGTLKLLDFGISKQIGGTFLLGYPSPMTLPFASPEQVGSEETTTLSDVYSLGVLLCVLLTGRLPYGSAQTAVDLRDAILHQDPVCPSEVVRLAQGSASEEKVCSTHQPLTRNPKQLARRLRGDLDAIVLRALSKEPSRRYASAAEFSEDIRRHLAHKPVSARAASVPYRSLRFMQRHRFGLFVACLAFIGLLTFIFVLVGERRETRAERDRAERQAMRAEHVSRFLVDLFQLADPKRRPGDVVTARELLDKASKELPSKLSKQPDLQVHMLNTLGEIYLNLGLVSEADKCQAAAFGIADSLLKPDSLEVADILDLAGSIRAVEGQYDEAARLYGEALKIKRKYLPPAHPGIADSLYNLGAVALDKDQYFQAERLFRFALDIRRKHPEQDQSAIAKLLNALGAVLNDLNRSAEAEDMLREALRLHETIYGKDHPTVAVTVGNLAIALETNGKLDEAEQLKRRALSLTRSLLGEDHPDVIIPLSNLGFLLSVRNKNAEAAVLFQEALSKAEHAFGNNHPLTIAIKVNLARSLQATFRFKEAERLLDAAYDSAMQSGEENNWLELGNILKTRAQSFYGSKQYAKAEKDARKAIEIFRKHEGGTSYVVAMTSAELGSYLVAQGHFEEAEPLLLEYLKVSSQRDRAEAFRRLLVLYKAWGKPAMIEKYTAMAEQQERLKPSDEAGGGEPGRSHKE